MKHPWLRIFGAKNAPAARLICFHHAGGGAQWFSGWIKELPDHVQLVAIQLPGRADRINEEPLHDLNKAMEFIETSLHSMTDVPYEVVGNSVGCFLAIEWLRRVSKVGGTLPLRFHGISCRAPHWPRNESLLLGKDTQAFGEELREMYGGMPESILSDKKFVEIIARAYRADVQLVTNWTISEKTVFPFPISVYHGVDDSRVDRASMEAWKTLTNYSFELLQYPGGHFFIEKSRGVFLQHMSSQVLSDLKGRLAA